MLWYVGKWKNLGSVSMADIIKQGLVPKVKLLPEHGGYWK